MLRVIVGTAGHVDHGKTRLIEALTGIDCDRWAEEKARGITLDLGFAHFEEPAGDDGDAVQLGFIDVPGHERFVHNALAGLGGIRIVLLVVAADEGVKPQTREHVAIATLLGLDRAVVALTKRDLVSPDLLELAELEVAELLAATPFAGAPVVPVASPSGDGVPELRRRLVELARGVASGDAEGPVRLPIDRAFQLRGLGAVVTGTLGSGSIAAGAALEVLPAGLPARVRSLQVHGAARERALPGERTAVQLIGVELGSLERGDELVEPGVFAASRTLAATFSLLAEAPSAIAGTVPIRIHLGAAEAVGRLRPLAGPIAPGGSGEVELRLARPIVAARGDRYVIRRPSPAATLGGGVVLDPRWRRRRGERLATALGELGDEERALLLWVDETGERGATAAELGPRLGVRAAVVAERLERLARAGKLLRAASGQSVRFVDPAVLKRVALRARSALRAYFEADRMATTMPKAELLARVLPRRSELGEAFVDWLRAAKVLEVDGGGVRPPGRRPELQAEEAGLASDLLARVEAGGLTPPSPGEFARQLGAKPQIVEGLVRLLVTQGKLRKLPSGLVLSTAAIDGLRRDLLATGWSRFTVAEFKDRFGLSRKWAIPLLEHLDAIGQTRRVGDDRQVVQPRS